jgi:15-cis-phytoene synthase
MTLTASYEYCTGIARSRAKNFYYSFLLLDADRRKAMCAVYAFMRYCDDLSDDLQIADRAIAPGVARLPRHGAPLPHPARVFP